MSIRSGAEFCFCLLKHIGLTTLHMFALFLPQKDSTPKFRVCSRCCAVGHPRKEASAWIHCGDTNVESRFSCLQIELCGGNRLPLFGCANTSGGSCSVGVPRWSFFSSFPSACQTIRKSKLSPRGPLAAMDQREMDGEEGVAERWGRS